MRKISYVAFSLISIFLFSIVGQASDGALEWSGKLEYEYLNYVRPEGSFNGPNQWNEILFYPRLKYHGGLLDYVIEGSARENVNYQDRSYFTTKEAYVLLPLNSVDLSIGKQIVAWGVSDEIRTFDYFRKYDYTDVLRKEDEGIVSLRATWYAGPCTVDITWAPFYDPNRISFDSQNPWSSVPVSGMDYTVVDDKPNSSQAGVRVNCQSEGFDYAFTYVNGYYRFPDTVEAHIVGITPQQEWDVRLIPQYRRIQVYGIDGNKSFSAGNGKGEVAYITSEGKNGDSFVKGVLGYERNFSRLWSNAELFTLIQCVVDKNIIGTDSPPGTLLNYNHPFEYVVTINFSLKFSERYMAILKGIFQVGKPGQIIQSEIQWKPIDGILLYGRGEYIEGQEGTYFSYFKNNDRLISGIRYTF